MPSIYNHDNACWGIRRSCDMFQYDLNDEIQSNNSKVLECHSNQNNVSQNTTYVHYSVSSNGYYGYQPHKTPQMGIQSNPEIEMDVEDISVSNVSQTNDFTRMFDHPGYNSHLQSSRPAERRKRQMTCESVDVTKRSRLEEAEVQMKSPIEEPYRKEYLSYPKCLMAHYV